MRIRKPGFLALMMLLLPSLTVATWAATADLSITNTTMPRPATVGKDLTYGMNVINNGPDTATNVRVTDALPAGVTFVRATFNFIGGAPTPCSGTAMITCELGTLGVGKLSHRKRV